MQVEFDTAWLFSRRTAAFLNLWYRTYEEAREALALHPARFLFPFKTQYVVCEGSMLEHLGIDTTDPDWARIGHDWHRPEDGEARNRLAESLNAKLQGVQDQKTGYGLCRRSGPA